MTSWLLFADSLVYKIIKPLRLGSLDATTPANRYQLCQDEVFLNRQVAGNVYLGVSSIADVSGGFVLVNDPQDKTADVREFAVVMRRLPQDRFLDQMVIERSIRLTDIRALAKKLTAFHASASIAKAKLWGSAQAILQRVTGNLAEARDLAADSLTRESIGAVQNYALRFITTHRQSLDNRARDGRVCEGHGNLRCESVCYDAHGVVVLGRIKHHESLRYVDTALEFASLAVDLDLLGRPDLDDALIEAYLARTKDWEAARLLPFYKSYRAIVQGKLEMLATLQADLPIAQRLAARGNARRLFALAHRYAEGQPTSSV